MRNAADRSRAGAGTGSLLAALRNDETTPTGVGHRVLDAHRRARRRRHLDHRGRRGGPAAPGRRSWSPIRPPRTCRCTACRSGSRTASTSPAGRPRWPARATPTWPSRPRRWSQRLLDAGGDLGRQDQPRPVRHRPERDPYAVPDAAERVRRRPDLRRLELGSALAVATGEVPFAVATDTAGSGRVPPALNGILGYKPSRGLISTVGPGAGLPVPGLRQPDADTRSPICAACSTWSRGRRARPVEPAAAAYGPSTCPRPGRAARLAELEFFGDARDGAAHLTARDQVAEPRPRCRAAGALPAAGELLLRRALGGRAAAGVRRLPRRPPGRRAAGDRRRSSAAARGSAPSTCSAPSTGWPS